MNATCCPLCQSTAVVYYWQDNKRSYYTCQQCHLVFVSPNDYLNPDEEKAVYDMHENSPDDVAYRRFLGRLFEPLQALLSKPSIGLDFGCGPGPTLSVMFEEQGHSMALYDCFYANNPAVLEGGYDFITATEVVEHLHQPGAVLNRLWRQIQQPGYLGLMTKLVRSQQRFSDWHYKNDPSHVCFFAPQTMQWLAQQWQARLTVVADDAFIFCKE